MGMLVVLPMAAAMALLCKKRIEDFYFLAICIIVSFIFAFGYSGNTIPGVYAGVILGGLAFIYCAYMLIHDKQRFMECLFTPGLWGYVLCVAVVFLFLSGKTDLGADNDTFWAHAPQVLNMYRYSDLGGEGRRLSNFSLMYSAPVYTSWCYFCNKLWFGYSDGINLCARQIFIISAFFPFFNFVKKNEWKKMVLVLFFIILIPNLIDGSYDFMPDIPMGAVIVYGTLLAIKLFRDKKSEYNIWYLFGICLCSVFASTMKRAGGIYIFGMVSVPVLYAMDCLKKGNGRSEKIKAIVSLAVIVASSVTTLFYLICRDTLFEKNIFYSVFPFLAMIIWTASGVLCWLLKKLYCNKRYFSLLGILGLFEGSMAVAVSVLAFRLCGRFEGNPDDVKTIFFRFFAMWFKRDYYIGERFGNGWVISDFVYIMILLITVFIVRRLILKGRITYDGTVNDIDNAVFPVFIGYTVYMMFYCFLYMMNPIGNYIVGDSIGYADRYLGPAVLVVTVVVVYELLQITDIDRNKILLAVLAFLIVLLPSNPFRILALDDEVGWDTYNAMYKKAGVELTEDDNVILLGPDHGYYYVFPAGCYQDYEVADCEVEPDEWSAWLVSQNYNYLVIEDYDYTFPDVYCDLFEGGRPEVSEWAIYSIEKVDDPEKGQTVRFVRCRK